MNNETLVLVIAVFVGLTALAQIGQLFALLALQKKAKELQQQVTAFVPRAESILESAKQTIDQSRSQLTELTSKTNDILDSTKTQLVRVDSLLADVSTRAKTQMDRAELVLDDAMGKVHETVNTVHGGVMKPLREIQGVTNGIRAAVQHMLKGGRPNVVQAHQDEEMFI